MKLRLGRIPTWPWRSETVRLLPTALASLPQGGKDQRETALFGEEPWNGSGSAAFFQRAASQQGEDGLLDRWDQTRDLVGAAHTFVAALRHPSLADE